MTAGVGTRLYEFEGLGVVLEGAFAFSLAVVEHGKVVVGLGRSGVAGERGLERLLGILQVTVAELGVGQQKMALAVGGCELDRAFE